MDCAVDGERVVPVHSDAADAVGLASDDRPIAYPPITVTEDELKEDLLANTNVTVIRVQAIAQYSGIARTWVC